MSWATWAATLVGAKPVWIYKLEKDDEVAFFTSRGTGYSAAPSAMVIDVFEAVDVFEGTDVFKQYFEPAAIAHSVIRETQKSSKKSVSISLPRTNAFAQKFVGPLGIAETQVTIWEGFENDTAEEFQRIFIGEVQLTKPTWLRTTLVCEDITTSGRGKGIAAVIQRPCRHALYHGLCTLALADFQVAGSATAMSSGVVTVTEASGQANGYYSGGIITYGTKHQLITSHTGTSLYVLGDVGDLEADIAASGAKSVSIAPGCNRSMAVCDTTFSNSANFGGFKNLTDSPFDGRSMT